MMHGVNLSGWLIPEPWVSPSLFAATGASNEEELLDALGPEEYRRKAEAHRASFVGESDFARMAAMGLDSVRIPVPWHVFGDGAGAEELGGSVGCLDRAFEWAGAHGVSVLLDLATVPGGQGDSNTSPTTPDTRAEWHASSSGREVALDVLGRLAARYGADPALFGIELLDSPVVSRRRGLSMTDGIPAHYLRNFYRDAYQAIRAHADESKAVVISSSGHPRIWRHFMSGRSYRNVWMDVHLYHHQGETALDISSPRGLSAAVARNRAQVAEARAAGFPVVVGEWSGAAVISDSSVTPEGRLAYERVFCANQLTSFREASGWYFQTWKTERRLPAWDARYALSVFESGMLD